MSKFIAVALIVGGLVLGTVPVMAQQGGIADPNTLAASGVVVPFFTSGLVGTVATLQVASPVGANPEAHMFFFNASCARIPISVGIGLTTNDIRFFTVGAPDVPAGSDGLITLARASADGFSLLPLDFPVHARMYEFDATSGRSKVVNPIIVNTYEFPNPAHWWSPLRSGATFVAPLQTASVTTDLILICPLNTIEGATGAAFGRDVAGSGEVTFTDQGFPQINPRFPSVAQLNGIRVRVYDDNEDFLRDFTITCTCISQFPLIAASLNPIYANAVALPRLASYTELTSVPGGPGINPSPRVTFTGYINSGTTGSSVNAFFAPLHNGAQPNLDCPITGPCVVVNER